MSVIKGIENYEEIVRIKYFPTLFWFIWMDGGDDYCGLKRNE